MNSDAWFTIPCPGPSKPREFVMVMAKFPWEGKPRKLKKRIKKALTKDPRFHFTKRAPSPFPPCRTDDRTTLDLRRFTGWKVVRG